MDIFSSNIRFLGFYLFNFIYVPHFSYTEILVPSNIIITSLLILHYTFNSLTITMLILLPIVWQLNEVYDFVVVLCP